MKSFRSFIVILLFCLIAISIAFIPPSLADSGWDSDYSSGSDWGGSSWDSSDYDSDWSSSYDHDYSSSYSSHGGSTTVDSSVVIAGFLLYGIFLLIFMGVYFISKYNRHKRLQNRDYINQRHTLNELTDGQFIGDSDVEIQKYLPEYTEKKLLEELYQIFVNVQIAWMEFDYDSLKKYCTEELYQSYKADLEVLKTRHGQNIMEQFSIHSANIMGIQEENGIMIIRMFLHASFYDYVIDSDTKIVTRGDKNKILHNQYNLEFVVNKKMIEKCPNCGADLEGNSECPYCHTMISNTYHSFVLSKKEKI